MINKVYVQKKYIYGWKDFCIQWDRLIGQCLALQAKGIWILHSESTSVFDTGYVFDWSL